MEEAEWHEWHSDACLLIYVVQAQARGHTLTVVTSIFGCLLEDTEHADGAGEERSLRSRGSGWAILLSQLFHTC